MRSLMPTWNQFRTLPARTGYLGFWLSAAMVGYFALSRAPATLEGEQRAESQSREQFHEARDQLSAEFRGTVRDELRGLQEGTRTDVQGLTLPDGFARKKLDARYPLGWAFFYGYGGRLVASEHSFKTVEVTAWPSMQLDDLGAKFSGGEIRHKGTGDGVQGSSVYVPGTGRWSPFQASDTCVWFELLEKGEGTDSLGVMGFAPSRGPACS
jgi:hypothetical protein